MRFITENYLMLQKIIEERRIEAMSYEEYLRQVVELAQAILHPEGSSDYPEPLKVKLKSIV